MFWATSFVGAEAPGLYGQGASAPTQGVAQNIPYSQPSYGQGGSARSVQSSIPGFSWGPSVNLAESYTTNSVGTSSAQRDDYLTQLGLNTDLHEHSRRVSLDANYAGSAYFYAKDTTPTQFSNNLQAVADVIAIPDYLDFR